MSHGLINPTPLPAPDWRKRFPFKLGAPSWVFPFRDDNLVRNVEYLSQSVDRVQLLLFGQDHLDEMLQPHDLTRLATIRKNCGLSYSVHLPSDLYLLDLAESPAQLSRALDCLSRIRSATADLVPEAFILHLDSRIRTLPLPAADQQDRFPRVLDALHRRFDDAAALFLVENTSHDLMPWRAGLAERGFGICADFGHLYHQGQSIPDFQAALGPLIRELHLHGFNPSGDHLPLMELDENLLPVVCSFLADWHGPVTLEIFQADRLWPSVEYLHRLMETQQQ